ncbi:MAG: N-formylglutamate amidohydrolase [Spirochaetales bacterium]|nr:N-formylglutamate amidohydrolase [Spirochaetales bacterium]
MDRSRMLFHVPHASLHFPFQEGFTQPDLLASEVAKLTDHFTDQIFSCEGVEQIAAVFSRVFCDVERFYPDDQEPMAKKGMGFYYTQTDDGISFRQEGVWKQRVYQEFYVPHHQRLEASVSQRLDDGGQCLILDGHSFSSVPFLREEDQNSDRPDICLGTLSFHTPQWLIDSAIEIFTQANLSVALNRPYTGSLVPGKFLDKDPRVFSLMIEINRRLYLVNDQHPQRDQILFLQKLVEKLVHRIQML